MSKAAAFLAAGTLIVIAGLTAARAGDGGAVPYKGSAEFERIKVLVGRWEGTSEMHGQDQKVTADYRLTAGGSALVEELFPGTPHEMTTVYHDTQGRLGVTHYCLMGNQPRMDLKKADGNTFEFDFSKRSDFNPKKVHHMHSLVLTFADKDNLTQTWTSFEKGKKQAPTVITLSRVR